jgi:hypothetical protein
MAAGYLFKTDKKNPYGCVARELIRSITGALPPYIFFNFIYFFIYFFMAAQKSASLHFFFFFYFFMAASYAPVREQILTPTSFAEGF